MDGRVRVVIADDDDDIRLLMEIAVRKAGMDLAWAAGDGPSALEAIRRVMPSLVVLDVSMPGLTGLDVCAAVRADPRCAGVKILVLSAGVDEASQQAALSAGADGFMAKPFSPKNLAIRLHSLADASAGP